MQAARALRVHLPGEESTKSCRSISMVPTFSLPCVGGTVQCSACPFVDACEAFCTAVNLREESKVCNNHTQDVILPRFLCFKSCFRLSALLLFPAGISSLATKSCHVVYYNVTWFPRKYSKFTAFVQAVQPSHPLCSTLPGLTQVCSANRLTLAISCLSKRQLQKTTHETLYITRPRHI